MRGCAKLTSFRRGLRYALPIYTGVVFLGDRTSAQLVYGNVAAGLLRIRSAGQKNSSIDDPARPRSRETNEGVSCPGIQNGPPSSTKKRPPTPNAAKPLQIGRAS